METREFLKRYAYIYCYAASVCLAAALLVCRSVDAVSSRQSFTASSVVIIDAGHGGIDGGATSCTGVLEKTFNLQISRKLEALLHFLGREAVMTRDTENSVATEGKTIREKKRSDLRNRVAMVNRYPRGILVSIHQNQFPDARYSGPQVFYAETSGSKELAEAMQSGLCRTLAPDSRRAAKPVKGVYLMRHVNCPAVLIECGFLSNPREEKQLRDKTYQQRLCCVLAEALLRMPPQGGAS